MAYIILKNGKKIGDYLNPYLVAEVNTSHFGDLNIAKKMLDKLKEIDVTVQNFNPGLLKVYILKLIIKKIL